MANYRTLHESKWRLIASYAINGNTEDQLQRAEVKVKRLTDDCRCVNVLLTF